MHKGRLLFCFILIAIAAFSTYSASGWTFKTGFFPLAVSIPLLILATVQLLLEIFGKEERAAGAAVDLDFASDVPTELARRRVLTTFGWIGGFIFFVYLIGFPLTVPLFVLGYLKFQSAVSWRNSVAITAVTWGIFYALFERLVHLQFEAGAVQTWLGL